MHKCVLIAAEEYNKMEEDYDYDYEDYSIDSFILVCDQPSNSNISYIWFIDNYPEILVGGQVAAAFLLLFLLIGLPLNLTVMTLILKKKLYKKPGLVLMFNLMLSDLLYILLVIPVQITTAITGEFWSVLRSDSAKCVACKVGGVVPAVFLMISLLTISFMSFDRFLFLYKPLRYNQLLTSVRVSIVLIVMWIISIIIAILPLVNFGHIIFDSLFLTCTDDTSGTFSDTNLAYGVFISVVYFIPIVLLIIFNLLVVFIILKNVRKVHKLRSLQDSRTGVKKEQVKTKLFKQLHVVRVFGGLLLANLISWLPVIVLSLAVVISGDLLLFPDPVHTVSVILFMMQVVTHPIVEIALLKDLRDPFTAFLCCFCGKKSAKRPDIMCCCHGGEESSRCACGLLSVLNAALLKHNSSDSATSQSSV